MTDRHWLPSFGLQRQFILIVGSAVVILSVLVWGVFVSTVDHLVQRLGVRFAEKQVLYDKSRTLQPLIREVALARAMADDTAIRQWAANENDPELKQAALAAMEKHRRHFSDGNYFLALASSGNYYYNNAAEAYTENPLRYTLDPNKPADSWFYATLKSSSDYHINVDPDVSLGVTKVWINVLLRDGERVLGVIGTGIDLTRFIKEVAAIPQPGITNLFIDSKAAIQLYRDIALIDFSSISKSLDQQRSIDQLIASPDDRAWIRQTAAELSRSNGGIETRFVYLEDKRMLAAMASLPEIGWFSVTLLDLGVLLPRREFMIMGIAMGAAALGILLVLVLALRRQVLNPVRRLTDATERVSSGKAIELEFPPGGSEVEHLTQRFAVMADAVQRDRASLTDQVESRLRELGNAKHLLETALVQEREGREKQASMLALLAHEIRNPMAVISNTAQILRMDVPAENDALQNRVSSILGGVSRIKNVLDTVMAEERLALGGPGLRRSMCELNALVRKVVDEFASTVDHAIEFIPMAEDASLCADAQLLAIAIGNLLGNAIKYTPAGSQITIRVGKAEAALLCVDVADNGPGIDGETMNRLFVKFERGSHNEHVPGTGLGLYLVRFIAQLHGGDVTLDSGAGRGTCFRISLPVRQGALSRSST